MYGKRSGLEECWNVVKKGEIFTDAEPSEVVGDAEKGDVNEQKKMEEVSRRCRICWSRL